VAESPDRKVGVLHRRRPLRPVLNGLFSSLSIAVGYAPIAFSFGLAAMQTGLHPVLVLASSVLVFAGASQFLLITLLAPGASLFAAIPTVLLMNARHLFYGPALLARFTHPDARLASPLLAFGLTDEVFAAAMSQLDRIAPTQKERWYLGLQLGAYIAWVGGTALGVVLTSSFQDPPVLVREGLSFILPALFFVLLLELNIRRHRTVILATVLACALLMMVLPAHHALALAMVIGALLNLRRHDA